MMRMFLVVNAERKVTVTDVGVVVASIATVPPFPSVGIQTGLIEVPTALTHVEAKFTVADETLTPVVIMKVLSSPTTDEQLVLQVGEVPPVIWCPTASTVNEVTAPRPT